MRVFDPVPPRFNKVARTVGKCAEQVYIELGPGLTPEAYRGSLGVEMSLASIAFEADVELPLVYRGVHIEQAMRIDFVVEEAVLVMATACHPADHLHELQLKTLLKFTELRVGLLINFNSVNFKQAMRKITT